ncbi:MAG: DUF5119 domain-containing protein [Rikenellaceae bacterium]|jgi:hypothetical protein|nr:DUF5119 domain-containing protein [Rikenellaceae bacterium]
MKRQLHILLFYLAAAVLAAAGLASCQNKELYDLRFTDPTAKAVTVRINWAEGLPVPTANGMRINVFSLNPDVAPHYGKDDVSAHGGLVWLRPGTTHQTFAYNYADNNLKFVNEHDPALIEAVSTELTRATYSRAFPDEQTIDQVRGDFHVGIHPGYTVLDTDQEQFFDLYPADAVKTYTFEIRGVAGAEFIASARGAISGFSASYFLATGELAAEPSTLLFNAQANGGQKTVTGSFRTFGRLDVTNNFTIEILYPSQTPGEGIVQYTWDVTGQIADGTNYHILIENDPANGIPEIPDPGTVNENGGWDVKLNEWNDIAVPLE